jgi:hypothetical protein
LGVGPGFHRPQDREIAAEKTTRRIKKARRDRRAF